MTSIKFSIRSWVGMLLALTLILSACQTFLPATSPGSSNGSSGMPSTGKESGAQITKNTASTVTAQGPSGKTTTGTQTIKHGTVIEATSTPSDTMSSGMLMTTPEPGKLPTVEVFDQAIVSDTVKIARVISNGPGWIVIYTQVNDQPGDPIGHASVKDGENMDVVVKIDAGKATPVLYALLHSDQGKVGTFEFPGPDTPMMLGVKMIQSSFKITTVAQAQATEKPSIAEDQSVKVSDQEIRGGTVRIDEVHSKGPGWIGIHTQNVDGSVGPPIGDAHVDDGITKNLIVKINAKLATGVMYAMLHVDSGAIGVWEFPHPDQPVMVNGQMVMPTFKITNGLPGNNTLINLGQSNGSAPFLVDGAGMTLYISLNDAPGKSNCDDDCRLRWFPLIVTGKLTAGNGVTATKLGLITLPDGSRQATYNGQPLYYYADDVQPGDTGGQGMDGVWFTSPP